MGIPYICQSYEFLVNLLLIVLMTLLKTTESNGLYSLFESFDEKLDNENKNYPLDLDVIFQPFGTLHTLEQLSFWANMEEDIVHIFEQKLGIIDEEIDLIEKYIKDYEESSGRAIAEASEQVDDVAKIIASNAVLSHLMTDRYATLIQSLRNLLESPEYNTIEDEMNKILEITPYTESKVWPSKDDLLVSHLSILNIQEAHYFHPEEIYQGETINTTSGGKFEASHCVEMAMFALKREYYAIAVDWLELAHALLHEDENDESISKDIVADMLNVVIQQHNYALATQRDNYTIASKSYDYPTYPGQPQHEKHYASHYYYEYEGKKYQDPSVSDLNMFALCKGEEFQPIEVKSKLKCFRYHGGHPYYIINPLNAEQLSESPPVIQYYNVLTESFMQELQSVRSEMHMSTVADHNFDDKTHSLWSRSSAGGLFPWDYSHKIWDITTRLTGLIGMERPQTVEYVYGRVYWHHADAYAVHSDRINSTISAESVKEDRIATVLYYMDVPVTGGNTPFCEAGVAAYPIRGSAVFWPNLYRSGAPRPNVFHGACPVLHGHKTIINQWIKYVENFITYPCSLNEFE